MSDLKKIRVQHVDRDAKGVEIKTDVDVITDADCITMDDGDLRSGVKKMINDRIGEVIDGAPEELDTLKEIATELDKNQSGVSTIIKAMNDKLEAKDLESYAKTTEVDDKLKSKVSVVDGKELSTNDFTDVDKQKLDAIENGAEKNKVTSVNGMTGDVVIEAGGGNVDLSGYAKTADLKNRINIPLPNKRTLVLTQKEYDLIENKDNDTEYNIRTSDIRVLCITNHFYAGLDVDKTDVEPYFINEKIPIVEGIEEQMQAKANVVAIGTLVVPDNTLDNQYKDMIYELITTTIMQQKPDIIIATPAFNATKYTRVSAELCLFIMEKLGVPAICSIYPENDIYKKYKGLIYMLDGGNSGAKMKYDMPAIVDYALKILQESYDRCSYIKKISEIAGKIYEVEEKVDETRKNLEAYKKSVIISEAAYAALPDEEKAKSDTLYFLI